MRDPIREKDLADACGDHDVVVDVADDGTATVTIRRDALDRLVGDGYMRGYDAGYRSGHHVGYEDGSSEAKQATA